MKVYYKNIYYRSVIALQQLISAIIIGYLPGGEILDESRYAVWSRKFRYILWGESII